MARGWARVVSATTWAVGREDKLAFGTRWAAGAGVELMSLEARGRVQTPRAVPVVGYQSLD